MPNPVRKNGRLNSLASRRPFIPWALYDWGGSAFPAVVSTFVIAPYVTQSLAPDPVSGQVQWGWMQALVGLGVALLAPILGALADANGRQRGMLAAFTLLSVVATAALWRAEPDHSWLLYALACVAVASLSFEIATSFYNAALPDVAAPDRLGRASAFAWGLGYLGGLACLGLALALLVMPEPAPFGLDRDAAEPVRATALLVAAWMLAFALPALVLLPGRPPSGLTWRAATARGLGRLNEVVQSLPARPDVGRLLLARLFYTDGLNTFSIFAAVYAAGVFGMEFERMLLFGIVMNGSAGLGCFAVGLVEDRIGARRVIVLALAGIVTLGIPLLATGQEAWFWALAVVIAFLFGAPQSASRTLMAHVAPPGDRAACFGLLALSGRATGFIGPAMVATVTMATESQSLGIATTLVFMAVGGLILACGAQGRAGRLREHAGARSGPA